MLFGQDCHQVGLVLLIPAPEISNLFIRSSLSAAFDENVWRTDDPTDSTGLQDASPGPAAAIGPRNDDLSRAVCNAGLAGCARLVRVVGGRQCSLPGLAHRDEYSWGVVGTRPLQRARAMVVAWSRACALKEVAAVARVVQALTTRLLLTLFAKMAQTGKVGGS